MADIMAKIIKTEELVAAAWEYARKTTPNPCYDDCEYCWMYRSDYPCQQRQKAMAFACGGEWVIEH